jgi:hypothetical protein
MQHLVMKTGYGILLNSLNYVTFENLHKTKTNYKAENNVNRCKYCLKFLVLQIGSQIFITFSHLTNSEVF